MTTASRSADRWRKLGYMAQVVESYRGPMRYDLFGIGDTLAMDPKTGEKFLIQAYADTKANIEKHSHMTMEHPAVKAWCAEGKSVFMHEAWKKIKGRWQHRVVLICG